MTTNSKNIHSQRALSHSEQAVANKNPVEQYEAILHFTQYSRAVVLIEAHSLAEASEKADGINGDDVKKWQFLYDDTCVVHVGLKGEGADDE